MAGGATALVLGATGGIGGAVAAALHRHGWPVRCMARKPPSINDGRFDWVAGDAMRRDDVIAAASGVSLIIHAVNPPGYRRWAELAPPMLENTIAAARAAGGARIMLPGNVYNFDPETTPLIRPDSPASPKSRKGEVRVALEARLEEASAFSPTTILRAGDFFGPGARSSWFAQTMARPGRPLRRIVNPARGAGHAWAYLPDLAEAFALLAGREQAPRFERLGFAGHLDQTGEEMIAAIRRVVGRELRVHPFPWTLMRILAPFSGFPREAAEIAPHWRAPQRLDNSTLVAAIGAEPRTALDEAMRATLKEMGCL
ncbi:MAG: NAD(P)H-binding protein [Pikeienuella sp.]